MTEHGREKIILKLSPFGISNEKYGSKSYTIKDLPKMALFMILDHIIVL